MIEALWLWLLIINLLAFASGGIDKWRAKRGKWRIAESTLLALAALGGGPGLLVAMRVFHHKTRHKKFTWGVPAIIIAQIIVLALLWWKIWR